MRKLIAAINMTIDGFCDHTYGIADDELHQHYSELLRNSGTVLFGRITYQLMQYWQTVLQNPTDNESLNEFAATIDSIEKVVFSHTLKNLDWDTARLAQKDIKDEVLELKQQQGKDILAGSPSMIVALTNLGLIDEYQLCIHPIVAGEGLPLFKNISIVSVFKLTNTKNLGSGAVVHYYVPKKQ